MNDPNNKNSNGRFSEGQSEYYRDPNGRNEESQNQIVNEEEQNRTINPGDQDWSPNSGQEPVMNSAYLSSGETVMPDGGNEVETPGRIEGDDAESFERKIPTM